MESFAEKYERLKGLVESAVTSLLDGIEEPLYSAIKYAVEGGGKRMRPVLFLAVLEAYGKTVTGDDAAFAAAIEYIHSYSLVHDDLPEMDNDETRRGKPSVHKRFGHSIALLAGDALLNLAFEIMSGVAVKNPVYAVAMRHVSVCSGARGMAGGQAREFARDYENAGKEELMLINNLKTSKLIEASVASGAIVAGKNKELVLWIMFASYFGCAFQLKDDLIDDSRDEKSVLSFIGREQAEKDLESNLSLGMNYLERTSADIGFIKEFAGILLSRKNENI